MEGETRLNSSDKRTALTRNQQKEEEEEEEEEEEKEMKRNETKRT